MSRETPQATRVGLERRRAGREEVPPFGGAVSVVGAQLLNVSAHGLLIESLIAMEVETLLPLRLVISGRKQDIRARVVQRQLLPGAKRRYRIGLEFVGLPAEVREELAQLAK